MLVNACAVSTRENPVARGVSRQTSEALRGVYRSFFIIRNSTIQNALWQWKVSHKHHYEISYLDVSATRFIHIYLKLHPFKWTSVNHLELGIFGTHFFKGYTASLYSIISRGTDFQCHKIVRLIHIMNSPKHSTVVLLVKIVPYLVFS